MPRTKPPYRADHVGSLLRPHELHQLREQVRLGKADAGALRQAEDRLIREVVKLQEDLGLRSITEQVGADFQRLRMGVGRDPNHPPGSKEAASWVLGDFPKAVDEPLTAMISAGCEDIQTVLALGIKDAMNKHNARPSLFPSA